MKEIGGYIELDTYHLPMLHKEAIALNCGRNALAYLIQAKKIERIKIPYYLCDSIYKLCKREKIEVSFYHIDRDFHPVKVELAKNEWLYLVNYYGQLNSKDIEQYADRYGRIIVDQAHGYFDPPLNNIDTIYTCRKWFGVPDGAFLYTNKRLEKDLPLDISFERMHFLLGRYEKSASEYYNEYKANNSYFCSEPIKKMSRLTVNLLHGIDYEFVQRRRQENFDYLHRHLKSINKLILHSGVFMYPLMIEEGEKIRRFLQEKKIYIPLLWPNVLDLLDQNSIEKEMAKNILPLPIDQRYSIDDMNYIKDELLDSLS